MLAVRRRRLPFALAVLGSLVVLFTPGPAVPSGPTGSDKVVHLALFALLALTGVRAGLRLPVLGVGLAGYAVLSELLQALLPIQRDGSVADAFVDLLGATAALLLTAAARWRRRTRPTTP